jgi:hypothetical protein
MVGAKVSMSGSNYDDSIKITSCTSSRYIRQICTLNHGEHLDASTHCLKGMRLGLGHVPGFTPAVLHNCLTRNNEQLSAKSTPRLTLFGASARIYSLAILSAPSTSEAGSTVFS